MYTVVNNNNKKNPQKNNISLNKCSSLTEAQAAGLEQRLHVLWYCTVPSVGGWGTLSTTGAVCHLQGPESFKKKKKKNQTVTVSPTVSENQLSIAVHEKTGS